MGYQEMDKVWDNSQAGKTDKLVLLAIARRYKPGVGSWPSQDYLAKVCGVNIRSIRASLTRLEALGELTWIRGSNLSKKSNLYFLTAIEGEKTSADFLTKTSAELEKTPAQIDKNTRLLNKELNKLDKNKAVFRFSSEFGSDFFLRIHELRPDLSLVEVRDWLVWFEANHSWHVENARTEDSLISKVLSFFPSAEGK